MRRARSPCERPAKTISRFCGVSGKACPTVISGLEGGASSSPGRACSTVPLSTPSFLDRLAGGEADERVVRNVVGDDGPRSRPNVVAKSDRSNEHSVDGHPDVAAD